LRAVTPLLAAQEFTAFHAVGILLAVWALVVTALGVTRPDFPGKGNGQKVVMAISVLLVAGAIGTAIGTSKSAPKGSEEAGKANKAGREGTGQPSQGGGTAPGTGANAGQQPGGNAGQKPGAAAPPGKPAKTLLISADPSGQLRFDKSSLQAPTGNVRITMNNPSPIQHNVALEGPGGVKLQGPTIGKGGSSQVQGTLKAGTYTYFCSVPGHRQAGMQGTLTVK
jgi:plastocyanin